MHRGQVHQKKKKVSVHYGRGGEEGGKRKSSDRHANGSYHRVIEAVTAADHQIALFPRREKEHVCLFYKNPAALFRFSAYPSRGARHTGLGEGHGGGEAKTSLLSSDE